MKPAKQIKRTSSLVALVAATTSSALAQTNSWTGGSSFYYTCGVTTCAAAGDNQWGTAANWAAGLPTATQDVNIGLSTYQSGTSFRPVQHDTVQISAATSAAAGNLFIGFSGGRTSSGSFGAGNLTNLGTLAVTSSMVVGSTGVGHFNNSGTATVGGSLIVGSAGQGSVSNSGTITVNGSTVIGQLGGVAGAITLTGAGSLVTGGNLTVGEAGSGSLFIASGSSAVTNGRVTLGTNSSGAGLIVNEGQMTTGDRLIVGEAGYGQIRTIGATATTATTGDIALGATATGVGIAITSQGTMSGGGRLDVGVRGEGYLIVDQGGEVNNGVGVIAKEPGARGYALVSGADSLWDNRQSLTLGSESNTAGVLVINDGGTVRIADGQGTLTIAEKAGSTGILNIGAMSPQGVDYGLHADVKSYLGGTDTDANARAPGTLDAAFVRFGEGAGTVNFKHTGDEALDYRFKAGFVGLGTVNHFEGFTVLDGDSSGFTGPAHVYGGIMVANNVLAGNVTVHSGGTLRIGHEGPNDAGETGHVVNDIVNNGVVQFNRSNTYTYGQVISGTGAVEQIGTGTTILTGASTYTGPTTVFRGTLQLGDGGTTGSIDATSGVDIRADGTFAFNRSDVKVFDRQITGTGTIRQIGTGVTRLTADSSGFTGSTFVDAGTLSVNGILGGTVDVNTGGTLEGLGQVGTTVVHAGGTIAPGNATDPGRTPIGTLTIAGNFTQEAGSFYQTEVRSTGESDLIHVTGTATIDPGAVLNVTKIDPARYELEHRYTVLTADGGRTGTYTLTGDTWVSTFYRVEDHYDANNVYLDVAQYRLFQEAGRTINQINAATAAQELKWQRDPATNYPTNALFRAIAYLQTDEEARYAFDQISGEIYASTKTGLLEESRFIREATGNRLRSAFGGLGRKVPTQEPSRNVKDPMPRKSAARIEDGLVLWGQGFGTWSSTNGDGNAASLDHSTGGFLIGADVPVAERFRVGLVGGYSQSRFSVDERHSRATSDNYHIGLYGGAEWNRLGLQLGASYTWHDISTTRDVRFPGFSESLASSYDASTLQAYGDLGYAIRWNALKLEPFGGLAYVRLEEDGYREKVGVAALTGTGHSSDKLYGTLGLRLERPFDLGDMALTARGMLGWRHAFGKTTVSAVHAFAGSSPFTVYGVPIAKNVGVVEAGVDAAFTRDLTVGVAYSGQFSKSTEMHGVHGNVNWKF